MKKILFFIIFSIVFLLQTLCANAEPFKILSMNYDNNAALIYLNITDGNEPPAQLKPVKLSNPNRLYFDINNAVLIGEKQQLLIEKTNIKEIRLAQFSTNPDVVRMVITFEEGFDTSNVKLSYVKDNIVVKCASPRICNEYFHPIYDETGAQTQYSSIVVNSQGVQKIDIPKTENTEKKPPQNVMEDIQQAFQNSTLNNSDGKTYESIVSIELSSDLKLRTRYFINGYYAKNGGLLVSGIGQITAQKMFLLDSPKRVVIDLPNAYVDRKLRNREINICQDGSCSDKAKIGQFEHNKARIVINSENAQKYIPIFSADTQSLLFINSDKLKHTDLSPVTANLNKVYAKKIDSTTNELILSFTAPVVHSIVRNNNELNIYMFNVKSYNEQDFLKTVKNNYYKKFAISLMPQIGIKGSIPLNKDDIVQISQGIDGKSLKFVIKMSSASEIQTSQNGNSEITAKRKPIKNKIVLDAGHGGTDYGAIREGINEKDITLDVTERVAAILKSKGYKVALTRSEDEYVSLQDRVDFSENENPEVFVSIHVNSAVAVEPYGIETHYYHEYSKDFANVVHENLINNISSKDRGVLKSKFYVINHTTVPAILVEMGFISNAEERAELITDSRKDKTAKAIANGIIEYLKKTK